MYTTCILCRVTMPLRQKETQVQGQLCGVGYDDDADETNGTTKPVLIFILVEKMPDFVNRKRLEESGKKQSLACLHCYVSA